MTRARRLAAVLAVIGLSVTSCSSATGSVRARMAVDGLVASPAERAVTPHLVGATLTGAQLDVAQWRGDVVVVNIWGSWCAPCRAEAPNLERVAQDTYSQGVRFLGIDIRDSRDSARAFEASYHVTYPSLFDPGVRQALSFGRLAPQATPSTIVLDRRGRVAARFIGPTTYAPLLATVTQVLAQG